MANILKKKFLNPLWIIVIFCSLAELTLGYAVFNTDGDIQLILTIFVVCFPVLIAIAFFLIVWFKPGHLYSPKDYQKDKSFLEGISNNAEIPVNVYLDTNDKKVINSFNESFKQLVEKNKLVITKSFPPKKGSWIAKFRLAFKDFVSTNQIKELTSDLVESYGEEKDDDSINLLKSNLEREKLRLEIEKLKVENISRKLELIESMSKLITEGLISVENASIRIGNLIVIKTPDENGKTIINNYILNEITEAIIDKNPELLNNPKQINKVLSEADGKKIKADNNV